MKDVLDVKEDQSMGRFNDKIQTLIEFKAQIPMHVIDSTVPLEARIVELNTDRLFQLGQYPSGKDIAPPYADLTVQIKQMKGQPTDRVTLKDTGDFHRSFYVKFDRDRFTILASDIKTQKLVTKYGFKIFGINEEDLTELIPDIYRSLMSKFKTAAYG